MQKKFQNIRHYENRHNFTNIKRFAQIKLLNVLIKKNDDRELLTLNVNIFYELIAKYCQRS